MYTKHVAKRSRFSDVRVVQVYFVMRTLGQY